MMNQMYSQHEAKFCFACGEKIEEEVRYCPYCGVDQNRGDNRPQGSSLKEQNTHKKSEPRNSQVNTMKPKPEPIRKNAAEPEVKIEPEPTYGYQASGSKPREGHKKEPLQDLSHKITKFVDKLADKIEKGAKKLQKNWEEANADKKSKIQKKNRKIQAKMEKKRMKTQYKIQKKKAKYQEKMEKKRKSHREKARKMQDYQKRMKKKPKKPMERTGMIIGSIIGLLFWGAYMYSTMLGNHDFFGPTFLAWMEKAALFAMLAASINLSRGLLGAKHYYLQGILIITHSILGLIFLQYVDVFKEALLTVPAIQGLEAEIIQDIILGLDIVTVIVFISVIISFIVSLVQAFRFKGKYKKYKKKMKIWNQQY